MTQFHTCAIKQNSGHIKWLIYIEYSLNILKVGQDDLICALEAMYTHGINCPDLQTLHYLDQTMPTWVRQVSILNLWTIQL